MIHKLKYTDKDTALIDLKSKRVISEDGNFINGTEAVVECGVIVLTRGTYDEQGVETIAPIVADGYHYDIMTSDIVFFENEILVDNPKYTFFKLTETT
jgi:hypothetical protein